MLSGDWPVGPSTLNELFTWDEYNANVLFRTCDNKVQLQKNFQNLLDYDIFVNEAYGGMGTGAYTLHLQHKHLKRTILRLRDQIQ